MPPDRPILEAPLLRPIRNWPGFLEIIITSVERYFLHPAPRVCAFSQDQLGGQRLHRSHNVISNTFLTQQVRAKETEKEKIMNWHRRALNTRTDFFGKFTYPFVALFLLLPSWGVAATLSVNCNAGGSVGAALKTLKPGDTLLVSGTCVETVDVAGQTGQFDGITLDGQGTATISGPDPSLDVLRLATVRGVTVKGFRITAGRDAIHVRWATNVFIMNNTIEKTARNGIQVTRGSWAEIADNVVQNNPRNGIEVQESTVRIGSAITDDATLPNPNRIEGNGGQGIFVSRGSIVRIAGNTIRNSGQNGVSVEKLSQADIASNTIEGNAQNGIQVTQNSGVNLGADTGTGYESLPNSTGTPNGIYGIQISLGAYADGRLGSLTGRSGAYGGSADMDFPINSLIP